MTRAARGPMGVAVLVAGCLGAGCGQRTGGGPAQAAGDNPLAGSVFWVEPTTDAARQAEAWSADRPADAAAIRLIATHAQAIWFGDSADISGAVSRRVTRARAAGQVPVLVLYNIPSRDCGQYSSGGTTSGAAYRAWARKFAAGLDGGRVVVIAEPDAVPLMDQCLSPADQGLRLELIADAVRVMKAAKATVYIDGGHAAWLQPDELASRLKRAGIDAADGFSLNTSNYYTTAENIAYGDSVSALVGGKHYVIDTSRNGRGSLGPDRWCNPPDRALGDFPAPDTSHALLDALLWIKRPGESDGTCNGGPPSGEWWPEQALELSRNAR